MQIDIDEARISLRYPAEVGLVGDSKRTLQLLLPLLQRNENREFLAKAQAGAQEWRDLMAEQASRREKPMKPQVVAHELGQRLSDTAIVTADSSTNTIYWARLIKARAGQMYGVSGTLASMGCGLTYAIAAQIAYPDRQCVAFVGDGGFSMLMAEFATCVKYNLPVKVVILKNNTLSMIQWEQMILQGNPQYGIELQPIDFAAFARACGGTGFTVEDPERCGDILDQALATPGPVIVEAIVDPLEPPMPPKLSAEEIKHFSEAFAKGQPDRIKIALTVGEQIREMI